MSHDFARRLRKNLTDAETFVWAKIRCRQIAGAKFRRQAPVGPFVADFVCFESKLVLELDGGHHAVRVEEDTARTNWLESQGFHVVRFWNCDVFSDWEVIEQELWRLLTEGSSTPLPNPPPQGGRGPDAEVR